MTGSRHRQGGAAGGGQGSWEAVGGRGKKQRQAGSAAFTHSLTLARCQSSVPAASLVADVNWYLPLPRCQSSWQMLPAHAQPGLGDVVGDWQGQKIPSQHGDLPRGQCRTAQGHSPSPVPPPCSAAKGFGLLMAGGGGRKNIQQTIAKVKSEQEGGRERGGCQIRWYSLETATTMAGILAHA